MRKIWNGCCTVKGLSVILAALVMVLVGVIVLCFVGLPIIVNRVIAASMRLEKNTEQWDRFVELPIPLITKVYIFNVTNPDDILQGELPHIQEVGPYIYKQRLNKSIISTDSSDDSVTYKKYTTASFDPELSGDYQESDVVTVINAPLLVLTQITSPVEQLVIMGCLDKLFPPGLNTLFINATIKKLIFEGFTFAHASEDNGYACEIIRKQVLEKTKPMKNIQPIMSEDDPEVVDHLKFSLLGFRIENPDGIYSMNRGIKDISQLGTIMRWNNSTETQFWGRTESTNNATCNRVRGGDSTIYPPKISKGASFEIFSTDICRTIEIYHTGKGSYQGIDGYLFEPNKNTFRSATPNAENDCFCTQRTLNQNGEPYCYLDGVMDVFDCFAVPLLLSFPHFLYADDSYIKGVRGLTAPDKSIHGIYLLIEPNTGTPLQGRQRVQLNFVLRPARHIEFAQNLTSSVLPLAWLDEGVDLSDELVDKLKHDYFNVVNISKGLSYGFIALFVAAVLVCGGILLRKTCLKW